MRSFAAVERFDDEAARVAKFVFTKEAPAAVAEAVLYRYPDYQKRTVICCSTQSGCPVGCRFCGAGDAFVRNLTADEIADQPFHVLREVYEKHGVHYSDMERLQIMFMSMGEPFLNMRSQTEPQAGLHITTENGEGVIHLTVPEDAKAGESVAIWTNVAALIRLRGEINHALWALLLPTGTFSALQLMDALEVYAADIAAAEKAT